MHVCHRIGVPSGTLSSTKITLQPQSSWVAAKSMPLLFTPPNLAGFKLAATMIFFPMRAFGSYSPRIEETMTRS